MTNLKPLLVGLLACAVTGVVAVPRVQAQPRAYVVSVAESPQGSATAAAVGRVSRRALRGSRTDWVEPDAMFLGYEPSVWASFREGMGALSEGTEAYVDLDLETAISSFQSAVSNFDAAASSLEDVDPLSEALFRLAVAQTADGQGRAARQTLVRLRVQFPDFQPDENEFNPTAVQAFRDAAPPDAQNPSATIEVTSDPPGALVFMDHVAVGTTPLAVSGLLGGTHVVRVVRPGSPASVREVTVRRNARTAADFQMSDGADSAAIEAALAALAEGDADGAEALASILTVERLSAFRALDDGTVEHLVFTNANGIEEADPLSGDVSRLAFVATREDMTVRSAAAQARDVETPFSGGGGSDPIIRTPDTGPEFYETWYFWAGIGVLAVAGGILAIILLSDSTEPSNMGQIVLEF